MAEQPDPNQTVDEPDPLDAGLAAAFGPDSGPPLPAGGSVLRALGASLPAVPRVQLREPQTEALTPVHLPGSTEMPAGPDPGGRLQLHGEIARGGMGAILKGRDTDLGRAIAVKVLLETHAGRTELVQRFVEEAQIAGQLQHPGITPVYELGQFADRRPYFTMKLVKGKTLAALLAARRSVAEEQPKYLGIFAQVCQTLAYAHARGVIHRDLKPANVMVGAYGEVQVMDWGLAKVLPEGGVADGKQAQARQAVSVIQTQRGAGTPEAGSHTQAGTVLGTPAYMAPEQARGAVDLVDVRADVFGLGAILCEVLTGQPPFTGKNAEAMRKAQTAQLADALGRLDGCGADADLVGLARRCLAAEPWDRPRDAGEVAAALAAYQGAVAERLRQGELAQARAVEERKARQAAQAQAAAERRARRLTLGLAASLLALVAVGAAGGLWEQRQRAEGAAAAQRQRQAVEATLDKAGELRQQARWAEARAVLEQARDGLGEAAPAELRQRLEQAAADLALVDQLEAIRLKRSFIVDGKFDDRGAERDYAVALRDAGLGAVGDDTAAVAARLRAAAVAEPLVAALDDWAGFTDDPERQAWLLEVARRADPDPWRDRFRDPGVRRDRAKLEGLAKELLDDERQLAGQKPQLLAALGQALHSTGADAVPLLAAAQTRHPDDFWLNFHLGESFYASNQPGMAVGFYRAALAARPFAAVVHNNLAGALGLNDQPDAAIREWRTASGLDPRAAPPHSNLGLALLKKGELDAAIEEFHKAIDIDPRYSSAHNNLGMALYTKGQPDAAIEEFHKAMDLDPKDGASHNNLGKALQLKGRLEAAIEEYHKAIELEPELAQPHRALGAALLQLGRFAEAREATRRSLELLRPNDPLRQVATRQLLQCEQLVALDQKLAALLEGKEKPADDAERLALAQLCQQPFRKLYAASCRFYAEAFAHEAKLADDMQQQHRYNAACAAALTGCGQGNDAAKLDDAERGRLRKQALDWLRADLAYWTKQAASDKPGDRQLVQQTLQHWQEDADLAGIRDKDAVAKLPADEQETCRKLWADVAELLQKAQDKPQ